MTASRSRPAPEPGARARAGPGPRLSATVLLAGLPIAVLALHAASYLPFMADDAFISLRYARRLLDGHGLTWNDGERVEGYSNLLWVLACAALGRLGVDLVSAARVLGVAGVSAAIAAIAWAFPARGAAGWAPALVGGLAIAFAAPAAVWAIGGLEQPLLAGLLAWAVALLLPLVEAPEPGARAWLPPAALLALVALTRPDGALFAGATALGVLWARGGDRAAWRGAAILIAIPAGAVLGQLAFRLAYYHDWVPNPAHAKLAFSPQRARNGLGYLVKGGLAVGGLLACGALGVWHAMRGAAAARRMRLLLVPTVAWCAYVAVIGGDVFPARRHLLPAIVLLGLIAAEWLAGGLAARARGALTWAAGLAVLALVAVPGQLDGETHRARAERWEWEGRSIGAVLRRAFGVARPLLAVDPAGCVPYFSGLPAVDMLGLNDHWLARHPPSDFGRGWIGHELGNGDYVLDRQPDLVLFCRPAGRWAPCFRSGGEMVGDPRFAATFRPVRFLAAGPPAVDSRIWMRGEGGPLGIAREGDRVRVPGYLLAGDGESGARARLDAGGVLGTALPPGTSVCFARLPLAAGTWSARLEASGGPVELAVVAGAEGATAPRGTTPVFRVAGGAPQRVDFELLAPAGAHVRALVLERAGG